MRKEKIAFKTGLNKLLKKAPFHLFWVIKSPVYKHFFILQAANAAEYSGERRRFGKEVYASAGKLRHISFYICFEIVRLTEHFFLLLPFFIQYISIYSLFRYSVLNECFRIRIKNLLLWSLDLWRNELWLGWAADLLGDGRQEEDRGGPPAGGIVGAGKD